MSFESGGEMQNPFEDEDTEDEEQPDPNLSNDTASEDEGDSTSETATEETAVESSQTETSASNTRREDTTQESTTSETTIEYITELDISHRQSTSRLANALIQPEYHEESPPVPFTTWRDGTSTGRKRTTIELNPDIDSLVDDAQTEFKDRYDTSINKADLREFALVYGLAHMDELFQMAEEWGIQYDN